MTQTVKPRETMIADPPPRWENRIREEYLFSEGCGGAIRGVQVFHSMLLDTQLEVGNWCTEYLVWDTDQTRTISWEARVRDKVKLSPKILLYSNFT